MWNKVGRGDALRTATKTPIQRLLHNGRTRCKSTHVFQPAASHQCWRLMTSTSSSGQQRHPTIEAERLRFGVAEWSGRYWTKRGLFHKNMNIKIVYKCNKKRCVLFVYHSNPILYLFAIPGPHDMELQLVSIQILKNQSKGGLRCLRVRAHRYETLCDGDCAAQLIKI